MALFTDIPLLTQLEVGGMVQGKAIEILLVEDNEADVRLTREALTDASG